MKRLILSSVILLCASPALAQGTARQCEALSSLNLPATVLDVVQMVPAGGFSPSPVVRPPAPVNPPTPAAGGAARGGGAPANNPAAVASRFSDVPAFCRIVGTVTTSPSSSIRIEVWLPEQWNGTYLSNGYSFYGGLMDQNLLAAAIRDGYATATTDAGGGGVRSASFLLNQPEKLKDVGARGMRPRSAPRRWRQLSIAGRRRRRISRDVAVKAGRASPRHSAIPTISTVSPLAGLPTTAPALPSRTCTSGR